MMEPNPNPWPLAWGLTGVCALTLVGGLAFSYNSLQPERVPAPKSYAAFTSGDKTFKCQYPEGWKMTSGERQGMAAWAKFKKGAALIDIDADLQGSLMADIMRSQPGGGMGDMGGGGAMPVGSEGGMDMGGGGMGGAMPDIPGMDKLGGGLAAQDRRPPIDRLHDAGKAGFEERWDEYQEQKPVPFQTAVGEARMSEFTYKGDIFTPKVRGYRISILGGDKLYSVVCKGAEGDWPLLKPVFSKVVNSLAPGGA